jgi:hypothetical protein
MRTASCICRDEVIEVMKNTRSVDPKDEEQWEEKVSRPTLALRKKFGRMVARTDRGRW